MQAHAGAQQVARHLDQKSLKAAFAAEKVAEVVQKGGLESSFLRNLYTPKVGAYE